MNPYINYLAEFGAFFTRYFPAGILGIIVPSVAGCEYTLETTPAHYTLMGDNDVE